MIGFPADFWEESVNISKVLSPKPPIRPHRVLSLVFFCLHQEGAGRSVLDGAAPMLATLFLAPGLTNVEMRPTRVVGRGEQAYDYDNRGQVLFQVVLSLGWP